MSLSGKVVLITGAASGIGAETARHLAKLNTKLSLVDRHEALLTQVINEIANGCDQKPLSIVADITEDAVRIINETIDHFGQLDVLVNNAGISGDDSIIDFDLGIYDQKMNVNIRAMIVLTSLAVPHLEKTKGNIVNISSVSGMTAAGSHMSYSISKAAVNQFTKSSAVLLAPKGVRVNAIAPGIIDTPLYDNKTLEMVSETVKKLKPHTSGVGDASNIARGIAYLATEPFINGIILPIDGGILC